MTGGADVYIAAMPRSGSTMLANLLTNPPARWILVEPWFPRGARGAHLYQQAQRFGLPLTARDWARRDGEDAATRVDRLFAEPLTALDRWGVKEVKGDLHDDTIAMIRPRKIVVLVRDIEDVALSMCEKHDRNPQPELDRAWMRTFIVTAAEAVVDLARDQSTTRVMRYEDFAMSAHSRQELAEWLDWPLDGDPGANLDLFDREYERDRHPDGVTAVSVARRRLENVPERRRFAGELAAALQRYQSVFGYAS